MEGEMATATSGLQRPTKRRAVDVGESGDPLAVSDEEVGSADFDDSEEGGIDGDALLGVVCVPSCVSDAFSATEKQLFTSAESLAFSNSECKCVERGCGIY